jgi:hypothetical protein
MHIEVLIFFLVKITCSEATSTYSSHNYSHGWIHLGPGLVRPRRSEVISKLTVCKPQWDFCSIPTVSFHQSQTVRVGSNRTLGAPIAPRNRLHTTYRSQPPPTSFTSPFLPFPPPSLPRGSIQVWQQHIEHQYSHITSTFTTSILSRWLRDSFRWKSSS